MVSKHELIEGVSQYLYDTLNEKGAEKNIPTLRKLVRGQTGSAEFTTDYPCLFVACDGREVDGYFTRYDLSVGIALTAANMTEAEEFGDTWEDILEEIYRTDCSLGGLVLDITGVQTISGKMETGVWMVYSNITVEVQCEN